MSIAQVADRAQAVIRARKARRARPDIRCRIITRGRLFMKALGSWVNGASPLKSFNVLALEKLLAVALEDVAVLLLAHASSFAVTHQTPTFPP